MALMDQDIRVQAETFVDQTFQGRISEGERVAIEKWLSEQLEQERQGWKKKVQMSLKEVEKERRLALDVHDAIHRLNDKFLPLLQSISLFREPSLYQPTDEADEKVNHVHRLEKNLDAILTMLSRHQQDRIMCFEYLNLQYNDHFSELDLLKSILELQTAKVEKIEKDGKEKEDKLNQEIKLLNETLDLHHDSNERIKQKHEEEVKDLKARVDDLKARLLIKSAITCSTRASQTDNETSTVAVQVRLGGSPKPACMKQTKNKGVQVRWKEKHVCVVNNHKDNNVPHQQKIIDENLQETNGMDTTIAVTDHPLKSPSPSEILSTFDILHKDFITRSKEEQLINTMGRFTRSEQIENVEFLRGKITEYTQRLEKAKAQAEGYKKQIVKLRSVRQNAERAKQAGDKNDSMDQESPRYQHEYTNNDKLRDIYERIGQRNEYTSLIKPGFDKLDYSYDKMDTVSESAAALKELNKPIGKRWASEGFLAGKQLGELDELALSPRKENRAQSTAKCLRCNRMYKKRNNTAKACRYHSKPKVMVEKYDSQGKLVKMVQVWGCCQGKLENIGCQTGQHV